MKKLLIIIGFLMIHCENTENEHFFDPKNLSRLSLDQLDDFWKEEKLLTRTSQDFSWSQRHLNSIEIRGEYGSVSTSVFKSQNSAIDTMERMRNYVAMVITEGEKSKLINEKWWRSRDHIFVNKWNTIIVVSYSRGLNERGEHLLISTALEIAQRIDALIKYNNWYPLSF